MTILVLLGFGFNIATNFEILTEIWYCFWLLRIYLGLVFLWVSMGAKGKLLLEQFVLEVELLPSTSPLTLVNGISCCFQDGASMNATWNESAKSGLVRTQDFATCLY